MGQLLKYKKSKGVEKKLASKLFGPSFFLWDRHLQDFTKKYQEKAS